MCDPVSIGLAVGGAALTGMQTRAQNRAVEAAQNERRQYYDAALGAQDQADARINQAVDLTGQLYTPEATQTRMAENEAQQTDSINNAILSNNLAMPHQGARGKVSDDYLRVTGQRAAEREREIADLVKNYARMAAPKFAAFDQAVDMQQYNDEINQARAGAGRTTRFAHNAADLVNVQPNSMAGILGALGGQMMSGGIARGVGNWGRSAGAWTGGGANKMTIPQINQGWMP